MAKAKRVFEIAKELGVTSKAIVQKCYDEDVPSITNHMSTVKMGLAQTIHEWFSENHHVTTAVESAGQVDLTKVRAKRREPQPTAVPAEAAASEPPESPEPSGSPELPATVDVASPATARQTKPAIAKEAPVPQAIASTVTEPEPPKAKTPTIVAPREQPPSAIPGPTALPPRELGVPVGRPNVPVRPEVMPVGERLDKPQAVKLRGPEVVRIEKPDHVGPPRPSRSSSGAPPRTGSEPGGASAESGIQRSSGPVRGRGAGTKSEGESEGRRRRSLTTRRGRYAESLPAGPTKFSEVDLAEQEARLTRAAGYLKQRRRELKKREGALGTTVAMPAVVGGKVEIAEPIFIKDLSAATGIKSADILKYLFEKGTMANINSAIGAEAAMEVCLEYNIELEVKEQQTAEQQVVQEFQQRDEIDRRGRPPVVTVLGHVDHGKTTLLDQIRRTDVVSHEAGGITQHIGAYRVTVRGGDGNEKTVVFLDTPGHEAFTSMRARGANMTDLVVLVVAADDGVMPQTIESINHAKAAEIPIIVVLNKIDKPEVTDTTIRRIYGQLAEQGLNPVEWGGQTEVVKVSATEGTGVTDLLDVLDYQAELLELTAEYGGSARGTVIEAEMQPGRGPVARVLVQQGQLRVSDFIVIGRAFGRVRDVTDDRQQGLDYAGPATPLELSGIDMVPNAGEKFYVTDTLQMAEQVALHARESERTRQLAIQTKVTLDNFADQLMAGQTKERNVVLKADVQGSIDVVRRALEKLGNDEVTVRVLHTGVGGVTESDVLLAEASDALIIGFHVVAAPHVRDLADQRQVQIRLYRVIYDVLDDLRNVLEGMIAPEIREEVLGEAQVKQVFRISKVGIIAGCLVTEGTVANQAKVRVVRDSVVVTEGRAIDSLRRVKDDVNEVRQGTECGIRLTGFDDVKPEDKLVFYRTDEIRRTLS